MLCSYLPESIRLALFIKTDLPSLDYVSDSGVRRARALVHSRAVGGLFRVGFALAAFVRVFKSPDRFIKLP